MKSTFQRQMVKTLSDRLREKSPLIQVLLGPRQVGKTTAVEQCIEKFPNTHYATADENLAPSPEWIDEHWQIALQKSKHPILVIDEVQKVLSWSDRIKGLWDKERKRGSNFKLVLLGSSSLSLSQGLEDSLTGRFELIQMPHWSYFESAKCFNYSIEDYLVFGGYPKAADFKDNYRRWQTYLQSSIIETVIGKDILRHAVVRKPGLFRQTFEVLSNYPAQEISYNKILGQLQESGNVDLVKYYISLFAGAFLFRAIEKFSGSVITKKGSSPKILPLAPSLYSYQMGPRDLTDPEIFGRVFECAVGSDLSRLPGQLFYWREGGLLEVDFIYQDGKTVYAIEVKSGRKKSTRGIEAFRKKYAKTRYIIITRENYYDFSKDTEIFLERYAT